MKRILIPFLTIAVAATLAGCLKTETKVTINNDATGTINTKMAYSLDSLESIAEQLENLPEGVEIGEDPLEKLEKMETEFTEKKLVAAAKETGVEVTSSKEYEKDGWKTVELAGTIKDVNARIAASTKASKAKMAEAGNDSPFSAMGGSFSGIKFFKTDNPNVGEVELMAALDIDMGEAGLPEGMDPSEMPEEMEEMMEAMFDTMKERFGINELSTKLTVVLPGKVRKTTGCTKNPQNEKEVTFNLSGASFSMSGVKDMFGMKDGVRATFEIPKDCKLKFEVKKAVAKATSRPTDKAKPADTKKKGGLGIEEDDGK